jgi:hypothetical protein
VSRIRDVRNLPNILRPNSNAGKQSLPLAASGREANFDPKLFE